MHRRLTKEFWHVTALAFLALEPGTPAASAETAPERCEQLISADFSSLEDAPTKITEARIVRTADQAPTCQVAGYVAPSVGFLVLLPRTNWNGNFIQLGCGGFCGSTSPASTVPFNCDDQLRRGYACAVSDNGHRSTSGDALWAYDNLQAELDHAFRAVHVTALASKSIVQRYYGRAARKSYFMGSSTGGRLGMMAAQRFPWDFDGIVAGVPSLSVTGIHMNLLWGNRAFTSDAGEPQLTEVDLDLLQKAVIAKCDLNDGVADGLIGDPRMCAFDPAQLTCGATKSSSCLSAGQVGIVRRIYGGPVNSRGDPLYMPGALKGSERTWIDWFSKWYSDNPRAAYNFVREQFRYGAFYPDAGSAWRPESFDFDKDPKRLGVSQALFDAVNPDLRRFKSAGGKLLVFAGWSDAGGMPLHTVDYYEAVERAMGGRAATQEFCRLFVLPGMGHSFGEGAFAADWLSYLEKWVEQASPPDEVMSFHIKIDDLKMGRFADRMRLYQRMTFPIDPNTVEFSRPVYPYPTLTWYRSGDPKQAASFGPLDPHAATQRITRAGRQTGGRR